MGRDRCWRIKQTPSEHFFRFVELRLPVDFRRASLHAIADLFQRVAGHVRTLIAGARDARYAEIRVLGEPRLQLPHHVRFRGDEERRRCFDLADVLNHRLGAADVICVIQNGLWAFRVCDRLCQGGSSFASANRER